MEYCLGIENNELQVFLAMYMSLKSARLSKRSQIHIPTTYCISSVQWLSRVWLCHPMDCSTPGIPIPHQLLKLAQTHVHWVGDAIQPSHPQLLLLLPSIFPISLFQWVRSLHRVVKVLEFQLQHQSFQRIFRADFL